MNFLFKGVITLGFFLGIIWLGFKAYRIINRKIMEATTASALLGYSLLLIGLYIALIYGGLYLMIVIYSYFVS